MTRRYRALTLASLLLAAVASGQAPSQTSDTARVPVATQWVLEAAGPDGRAAVSSIYLIVCSKKARKGTGFLLRGGTIITNEHVVSGCSAADLSLTAASGQPVRVRHLRADPVVDLAALTPAEPQPGGLILASTSRLNLGSVVRTWGYPLSYNGPAPLLSVGYVAGFRAEPRAQRPPVKRLVVNGAFNSGNSGGPLLSADNQVVGVVVMKALPILDESAQNALRAFKNNSDGEIYIRTDEFGNEVPVSGAQMIAMVAESIRQTAQVMIGEAIAVEDLAAFLAPSSKTP